MRQGFYTPSVPLDEEETRHGLVGDCDAPTSSGVEKDPGETVRDKRDILGDFTSRTLAPMGPSKRLDEGERDPGVGLKLLLRRGREVPESLSLSETA